jgi:hypothetical protein
MKRLDLYKAQLKAAKAELKIRTRQYNAAERAYLNNLTLIDELENKIANILAKDE